MRITIPVPTFALSAALAASLMGAAPAAALDVSGNVLDKLGMPINLAKVCIQAEPSKCVSTNAKGEFRIQSSNAIRPSAPGRDAYRLDLRDGRLDLRSPAATPARLEWLTADGRRPLAIQDLDLAAGRNALALPAGLPRAGVSLLRLSTPTGSFAWKAVLATGATAETSPAGTSARVASLAKATAAGMLEVSKAGYRTRLYEPSAETETGALIFLSLAGDMGLQFDGTYTAKVIAIDRAKKTLISETVEYSCGEDDQVERDTIRDTSNYAILGGKMYVWVQGECRGQIFTGSGTDPVGTWTMTDDDADLPADLKAGCVPDSSPIEESPFESFSAVYTITETAISGKLTVEVCPSDLYGPLILILFGDSAITVEKNTCKQIVLKNGKNETASLDFSKEKDSLHIAFAYGTTKCAGNQDMALTMKEPVCPDDGGLMGLVLCMIGSGFSENVGGVEKASALPKPRILPMSREAAKVRRGLSIFTRHGAR